jgi:hypothetical protein
MASVHTYHCVCSSLVLASPYTLSSLPQRASPGLDSARILPLTLPEAPSSQDADISSSMLLSSSIDRKPLVVMREDGFEKRWLRRCDRCRVSVGYYLKVPDGEQPGKEGVIYLFEEGLTETEVLRKGLEGTS